MTFFQIKTYSLLFQLSLGHKRLIFTFKNQKKKKIKRPVKIPIFGFRHIICHKRCFVSQHFLFLYLWISIDHHPDITVTYLVFEVFNMNRKTMFMDLYL